MAGIRQRTGRKYVSAGWQENASLEKAVSLLTASKSFVNMVPEEIRKESQSELFHFYHFTLYP
jgi:hypothetical protein